MLHAGRLPVRVSDEVDFSINIMLITAKILIFDIPVALMMTTSYNKFQF
jgi:hypothetical protein